MKRRNFFKPATIGVNILAISPFAIRNNISNENGDEIILHSIVGLLYKPNV